jgi:hypothetical protein
MRKQNIRFLAGLIAAVLLLHTAAFAASVPDGCSPWAAQGVEEAITLGIIPENLQADYTAQITRKEFAQVAVSFLELQFRLTLNDLRNYALDSAEPCFEDVDDAWVNIAYRFGIVTGRESGIFDPDALITREEAAVMLTRTYLVYAQQGESGFPERGTVEIQT